ncbi:MAG: hypothetical protein EOP10_07850 [Proteobacteria bacterium]|nr:MAG: hypothetical protein EOP10_07850 [Pseudomonadota bacterium]
MKALTIFLSLGLASISCQGSKAPKKSSSGKTADVISEKPKPVVVPVVPVLKPVVPVIVDPIVPPTPAPAPAPAPKVSVLLGTWENCIAYYEVEGFAITGPGSQVERIRYESGDRIVVTSAYFSDLKCANAYNESDVDRNIKTSEELGEGDDEGFREYLLQFITPTTQELAIELTETGAKLSVDPYLFTNIKVDGVSLTIARQCRKEIGEGDEEIFLSNFGFDDDLNCKGEYGTTEQNRSTDFNNVPVYSKK